MAIQELGKSRPVAHGPFKARFKTYYRGAKGDFSLGADGWTGSGLPTIGASLTSTQWSGPGTLSASKYSVPVCVAVDVDPRVTPNSAVAVAVYEADRIWEN